ncbi:DUF7768 domain-containing protein [Faecalibaculum rodentium]|jgi:hypothetical protein|uniref:DUF7768 domain-containing protein n=1 Tax=Faecalibaculum rodentium TaxID=1702221 RepID=UPI0025A285AD|nr:MULTISPECIES: hypothetical protein [Bacteria]
MKKNDLVYICSPLSAPTKEGMWQNMENAEHYARLVSEIFGCRAIAPHSFLPEYLDDHIPEEREAGLAFGLSVLKLSKAIIVCGSRISSGMQGEIKVAGELDIPAYVLLESEGGAMLAEIKEMPGPATPDWKGTEKKWKHIRVAFYLEEAGLCRDTFRTIEGPERYFNRSTADGIWYTASPAGNYCENDCTVGADIVFEIVSNGEIRHLDGNGDFPGKKPFIPFREFEKTLAADTLAAHPGLKDYHAMKEKLISLPGGEAYADPRRLSDNWLYALNFGEETEETIGTASWLGTEYHVLAVRYTHKPTGFAFRNYRFRRSGRDTRTSSHDLLLYDWDEESTMKGENR